MEHTTNVNYADGAMNYPSFPPQQQQQPFAYQTTPYQTPPQHTAPYPYPTAVPQHLQQQQHQHQPQYFQSLPQGNPTTQRQAPQRQQTQSHQFRNAPSPVPDTPGHGPGAPPPTADSPPASYEVDLMNALRQENEAGNVNVNVAANTNPIPDASTNTHQRANADDDDDDDQDVDDDEPVYQLPPPPEAEYPNEVELEKAIHAWSLEHGYELVRRASKKNAKDQLYKRYFHCSKHGRVTKSKTPDKERVRVNRKSNRIGCPMSLAAVSVNPHDPSGNWQIRHRKTHHNHPAVDASELAGHRRRARKGAVEQAVDGLFTINTPIKDVLTFLQRAHPEGLFKRTDVANMKLKFSKTGTCTHPAAPDTPDKPPAVSASSLTPTPGKTGFPSACNSCRSKKSRCDSVRPVCGTCAKSNTSCIYSHEPHPRVPQPPQNNPQHAAQQAVAGADAMQIDPPGPSFVDLTSNNSSNTGQRPSNTSAVQNVDAAAKAQDVFAALAAFQQEHVKPQRLTLEHSSVEYLASSTCGSGESYKSAFPRPFVLGSDWRAFSEAFESAAIKENCADVLRGEKREPVKPVPPPDGGDVEVTEWNEYVKQLAVFKRRNDMLKLGFRETLSPGLWSRVRLLPTAHDIWTTLEDMCMPRGSDQAYLRFSEISNTTLQTSGGNLDQYIHNLEMRVNDYNALALSHESRRPPAALNQSNTEAMKRRLGGNGTLPEEVLCFLFLKGLGPQHQNLAANLMKKNNIGGFGSGDRMGFMELAKLVKRLVER